MSGMNMTAHTRQFHDLTFLPSQGDRVELESAEWNDWNN
jgi:hypothetical protein